MRVACENCFCWHRSKDRSTGAAKNEGECRARSPQAAEATKKIKVVVTYAHYGCVHDFVPVDRAESFIERKFGSSETTHVKAPAKKRKQSSKRDRTKV